MLQQPNHHQSQPQQHRKDSRNIQLTVAYEGTDYYGWQRQGNARTVQLTLENALQRILQEKIQAVCAGRTDSGVHAFGNVAHFSTSSRIKCEKLLTGLNAVLPLSIRIVAIQDREASFHARYSAVERWYRYYLYNSKISSPFWSKHSLFYPFKIDDLCIKRSLKYLVGEHDFSSFCAVKDENRSKIRRIFDINLTRKDQIVQFDIRGSGFLHNMIRIIVGTALTINKNDWSPVKMKEILDQKDRRFAGMTVPPEGLFLMKVYYKEDLTWLDKILEKMKRPRFLFNHLS